MNKMKAYVTFEVKSSYLAVRKKLKKIKLDRESNPYLCDDRSVLSNRVNQANRRAGQLWVNLRIVNRVEWLRRSASFFMFLWTAVRNVQ